MYWPQACQICCTGCIFFILIRERISWCMKDQYSRKLNISFTKLSNILQSLMLNCFLDAPPIFYLPLIISFFLEEDFFARLHHPASCDYCHNFDHKTGLTNFNNLFVKSRKNHVIEIFTHVQDILNLPYKKDEYFSPNNCNVLSCAPQMQSLLWVISIHDSFDC